MSNATARAPSATKLRDLLLIHCRSDWRELVDADDQHICGSHRVRAIAGHDDLGESLAADLIVLDGELGAIELAKILKQLRTRPSCASAIVYVVSRRPSSTTSCESRADLDAIVDDWLVAPLTSNDIALRSSLASKLSALRRSPATEPSANQPPGPDRDRLLANVLHETNNPLNVIKNNVGPMKEYIASASTMLTKYRAHMDSAQASLEPSLIKLLEQTWDELDLDFVLEDFDSALQAVATGVERVLLVQNELRSFLRGETIEPSALDLNAALEATVGFCRRGSAPDITWVVDLSEVGWVHSKGGQIEQVFLNLVKNALDAAGPTGTITCTTHATENTVKVEIQDDGPGVPEELREKIFVPFFSTKGAKLGTGLGLTICSEIAADHGGRLYLDESHGCGARFVVELPRQPDPLPETRHQEDAT